ncbi:MAG: rhodanese-like domain-containing protein [Acidobacteriota bacterium]|nr:rhodanese-like domain-containing protein [Acidobacteriota bacterium]
MEKSFSERVAEAKTAVSPISPREAANLREGCEPVVFIDPRPADAIASTTGLIPGAHRVALADITGGLLPSALSDKWARVVTTCQAGPMAAVAAHELVKQGFRRVSYLEGGTTGWLEAGLSTER